jgi:hypothetical protein
MKLAPLRLNRTLGPSVVRWIEQNLCHGPGDVQGQEIELDDERVKFILRAYEIDDLGRRVVRRAALSRSKGWGKSEFAGMIVCAEALGPVRFRGWDNDGKPLGGPVHAPYVPVMATEEQQAGHIYGAVEFMLRHGPVSSLPGLDVGMTRTFVPGGGADPAGDSESCEQGGRQGVIRSLRRATFVRAPGTPSPARHDPPQPGEAEDRRAVVARGLDDVCARRLTHTRTSTSG